MPTTNELVGARYHGRKIAEVANKLTANDVPEFSRRVLMGTVCKIPGQCSTLVRTRTCRDSQQAYCRIAHPVRWRRRGRRGMGMRVEPTFGHAAFGAFAIVLFQQGHA